MESESSALCGQDSTLPEPHSATQDTTSSYDAHTISPTYHETRQNYSEYDRKLARPPQTEFNYSRAASSTHRPTRTRKPASSDPMQSRPGYPEFSHGPQLNMAYYRNMADVESRFLGFNSDKTTEIQYDIPRYHNPHHDKLTREVRERKLRSQHDTPATTRKIPLDISSDCSSSGGDDKVSQSRTGVVVESVGEFTQSMTASFVRFIFDDKSSVFRRLLWFVMWVICTGYALSNIYNAFNHYLTFETSTKLSYKNAKDGNLSLPAITICNMNKYRKSWLSLPRNQVVKKFEDLRVWGRKGKKIVITDEDIEKAKTVTMDVLESQGRHSLEDMFHNVKFGEQVLYEVGNTPLGDDWKSHFTERFTELGSCYTFNADGRKKVKRTGANFGATFTIHINQNDYADTQESAGIKVMLHHYQEPPLIKEFGLAIPPGSNAFISTRTLQMYNLGPPYKNSNCTSTPQTGNGPYSQMKCTLACNAEILATECKCQQSHMPLQNVPVCNLYENQECAEETIRRIHQGHFNDRVRECWCNEACSSTSYSYSLSTADYPSVASAVNLVEKPTEAATEEPTEGVPCTMDIPTDSPPALSIKSIDDLKENYILLHVYFETLAVEKVQKVPSYSVTNLLGDLGGNLGLFIGASVATLAEVLDYVARVMYAVVKQ